MRASTWVFLLHEPELRGIIKRMVLRLNNSVHYRKSPRALFVACVPHLGRCYRGGHENEPGRLLTMGRPVRACTVKCMLPQRPRFPQAASQVLSPSVVSDSWPPRGLQPSRLLCVWDFPGKNTGAGCHFLLQGIIPTQGSNLSLLHLSPMLAGGFFTTSATWPALPASDWGLIRGRCGCPGEGAVLQWVALAHQLLSNILRTALHFERRPSIPHLSFTRTSSAAQTGGPPTPLQDPPHFFNRFM